MSATTGSKGLRDVALRVPIFFKVMGIAIGLTLLLSAGMLWQIHQTWHRRLRLEADERARLLGADLAAHGAEFMLARDAGAMQRLLDDAKSRYPGLAYILALDARHRRVADTLDGEPSAEVLAANDIGRDGASRRVLLDTEQGEVRDVAVPVLGGRAGVIRIGMSEEPIGRQVAWMVRRLAGVTAAIAAVGIVAAWGLARLLTQPLLQLVDLSRAVSRGDYRKRARVSARDEVGELASAFNEMTASLEGKERSRQALLRKVIVAGEDERKRIARELHDHTGQSLVSLIASLGTLRAGSSIDDADARLDELEKLAAKTLSDVHDLARALRPSVLDDLGLMPALSRLTETVARQFGLSVSCEGLGSDDGRRLPAEIEIAVYRIVQEALTNAARHGRARAVHVLLQRKQDSLLVIVEDDGRGFDARNWRAGCSWGEHLGLLGIEERAALLGGTLRVESGPTSGTELFVEIPLSGEGAHEQDSSADRG
jgi:signal transduction histidine kinase